MTKTRLQRLAQIGLALFVLATLFKVSKNPCGAHEHRQLDNAGIGLSMAAEIREHGLFGYFDSVLRPRLLQRDLTNGINITEFPAMFAISGPLYLMGARWGTWLTSLVILGLALGAGLWALPRFWELWGIRVDRWWAPIAYFSVPGILYFSTSTVSEGVAFPLFLMGITLLGESWKKHSLRKLALGTLLAAIAIATKPPVIWGYLAMAVYALELKPRTRVQWLRIVLPVAGSLTIAAWWYGPHARAIASLNPTGQYTLAVTMYSRLSPLSKLMEFSWIDYLALAWRQIQKENFPFLVGALLLALGLRQRPRLGIALGIAFFGAVSLLGRGIVEHAYYFYGLNILSLVVLGEALASRDKKRWLKLAPAVLVAWGFVYSIRTEIWLHARSIDWWRSQPAVAATAVAPALWITDDHSLCPTKLVMSERPGTMAGGRLDSICESNGYKGKAIAYFVDSKSRGKCLDGTKVAAEFPFGDETWQIRIKK